jgi:hypothetical protein
MSRHQQMWPDTGMSMAFLLALVDWVKRHVNDSTATVVLPIGQVNVVEVAQVLHALERARRQEGNKEPAAFIVGLAIRSSDHR